jgi:hypothetical protein
MLMKFSQKIEKTFQRAFYFFEKQTTLKYSKKNLKWIRIQKVGIREGKIFNFVERFFMHFKFISHACLSK